ncbi:Lrr receptor kinase bak1 [Thalictrum thalictroides]|uniref:Lrr receptor kinase bak1 n=1 Tax=Thalictrum thalictroides TaxID=46969 RepID=A0A7J6VZC7_THATH|nr:Lrr receptor kinase bak1 [Thalictrum thalictroides]
MKVVAEELKKKILLEFWNMHRRFRSWSSCSHHIDIVNETGPLPFLRRFSYDDIKKATGGFSRIIARYSHGAVYKAQFQDGLVAIVKELREFLPGKEVFHSEVQVLGCLHHRHLVALLGFSTGPGRFLVFEYSENGSLKDHLNDPLKTPLTWRTRLQIAIGVAAALEYLQFFCEPPIHHVSVNSSNVLLDENFVAKISDVGLLCSTESHVSSARGCIDRESTDVIFQLGVLILELITGQSEKEGTDLVLWVQGTGFTHSVHKMVDPDLGSGYDSRELRRLLTVARFCTKTRGKPTCSVKQILRFLKAKMGKVHQSHHLTV